MKQNIINAFEDLAAYEATKRDTGYQFKIAMYRKAVKAFKLSTTDPKNINNARDILKSTFKNPVKIDKKLQELFNTGKKKAVNKARSDPILQAITLLSSVPQIGPVKAKKLVIKHNILSINELKKRTELLNDKQKLGLKYYDELIDPKTLDAYRIPRTEIILFEKQIKSMLPKGLTMNICGSYRRGAAVSGDIDLLFTGRKKDYTQFVIDLLSQDIIKDPFSSGDSKWMGMGKILKLHRRIDLMYISPEEYSFALLYFTGSQDFNEALRGYCRKQGLTLNEHGIKSLKNNKHIIGDFKDEMSIFSFLKLQYIEPTQRNFGQFTLNSTNKFSSIKLTPKGLNEPKDKIHCLKGKGLGGFTISEMRNILKSKGIDSSGTKKELCSRLFKDKIPIISSVLFNVSKGVLLSDTYKDTDPTGMYASEKFDGVRAIWNGSELKSRTNKTINAPKWFLNYLPTDNTLDGELYLKRASFEAIISIVSKKIPIDEEWKKIKFMVFDVPSSSEKFSNRINILDNIVKSCKSECPLIMTKHTIIKSKEHMKSMFNNIVSKNGEGIMLRDPNSFYEQKRSKKLLKVKPTDDAEAIIINMIEGKGKNAGSMGALKMQTLKKPFIEFRIGTGFTQAMRKNYWIKKTNMIGNTVTYTYKGLTAKGVPRHPAFMRLRVDKNI